MKPASKNSVLWAMIVSMTLGNMPWYNFSALLKQIAQEFSLTSADTGFILGAFQLGYVIVVGFTGWLADKVSLKRIVFWATLLTGFFAVLFAWLAGGLYSIMVLRLLTGLCAGAIYVPGMALLSRWFPANQRGKALGAYTGALVASYAGGYLVASYIASLYGWRAGVISTSLPAILAAFVVLAFVQDKQMPSAFSASASQNPTTPQVMPAPRGGYGGALLITTGYVGHMWELYAFWGWVGPFLVACALSHGLDQAQAAFLGSGLAAGIILLGAPASWLWGMMADRMGRTVAIMLAGSMSLAVELFLGFLYGHSLALVAVLAAWVGFWVIADSAIFKAGLTEMVEPGVQGFCLGLQSVVGFGVTIISPMIFGQVMEYYNGPVEPTRATVWGPSFMLLGLGGLLAPLGAMLLRRHRQSALMNGGKR